MSLNKEINKTVFKHKKKLPFIAFCILIIIWLIHFYFIMDEHGDYGLSFSSSLLEDIIFFAIFGVSILIMQNIRPEENIFETRVRSLANNTDVKEEAKKFLIQDIEKALAYTESNNTTITISKIDDNYVEVFHDSVAEIVNMCNDKPFKVNSGYSVTPDVQVGESFGYIKYAGIRDKNDIKQKEELVCGPIMQLKEFKTYTDKTKKFEISSDSSAISECSFAFFNELKNDKSNISNWNWVTVKRYTNNLNLKIINNTGEKLKIDTYIRKYGETDSMVLEKMPDCCESYNIDKVQNKERTIINNQSLYPRDSILYFISK